MPDFVRDYLKGMPSAQAFFSKPVQSLFEAEEQDPQVLAREPEELRASKAPPETIADHKEDRDRFWPQRHLSHEFVAELQQYQKSLGLERAIAGDERIIITGQQPGLLTGPLYTIYKAITAIRLAGKLGPLSRSAVLPVFWIGADDHDFEEMRGARILTRKHDLLSLRYEPVQDVDGLPMFRVPLEESLHALVDLAADAAPGSEFANEVRQFLHDSLAQSASFSEWFARIMARLFRDTPLVIFTPELTSARRGASSSLHNELQEPLRTSRLINEAAAALRLQGYAVQLEKSADECSFFLFEEGRRRKVTFDGELFQVPETGASYTRKALELRLVSYPEDFSPNVALRCIVQQALFRPDAYVAGPGEIAYWAQFQKVFAAAHAAMPVVYPRSQAVLTTLKLNKLRDRYALDLNLLQQGVDAALNQAMLRSNGSPALAALRAEKERLLEQAASLGRSLEKTRATASLRALAQSFHEQTRQNLERLELAAAHDDARQVQTVRQQVERLCTALAPERKLQERYYSIFSFLFEYGWDLIPRLIQELDSEGSGLQEIEL